jgi:hypothetical protein
VTIDIAGSLATLRAAGAAGRIEFFEDDPASAASIVEREADVRPHYDTILWTLPPSYRAMLAESDSVYCARDGAEFRLLGAEEMVEINLDLVHLPEGVSRDDERMLSTNHLVGFASAGHEAVWCFDVTQGGASGEYPVYYHHQDEPRVRFLADGAFEDPADDVPDLPSFGAWLDVMARAFAAPQPPEWFDALGTPGMVALARKGVLRG